VIFDAAAAVLLGGTSFAGGIGGVGGTATGVAFLATLQQGLSISGVQDYWQQIITGVILVIVVLLDRVQRLGLASIGIRLPARGVAAPTSGETSGAPAPTERARS
jgi:ribose/xylose/arabinose/galactoside ABC-type transport system permease subunit